MRKTFALGMGMLAVVAGLAVPTAAQAVVPTPLQTAPPPVCKTVTVPPKLPLYECINLRPGTILPAGCYSTKKLVCSGG